MLFSQALAASLLQVNGTPTQTLYHCYAASLSHPYPHSSCRLCLHRPLSRLLASVQHACLEVRVNLCKLIDGCAKHDMQQQGSTQQHKAANGVTAHRRDEQRLMAE